MSKESSLKNLIKLIELQGGDFHCTFRVRLMGEGRKQASAETIIREIFLFQR